MHQEPSCALAPCLRAVCIMPAGQLSWTGRVWCLLALWLVASSGRLVSAQDPPPHPACADQVTVFADGAERAHLCPDEARKRGLTVVDLSSTWTPRVLAEANGDAQAPGQPYRATYLALADEREEDLGEHQRFERHLELYGITPSLRVLRARFLHQRVHVCSAAVSREPLQALGRTLSAYAPDLATQRKRAERAAASRSSLERARLRLGLASLDELERQRQYVFAVRRYRRDRAVVDAIAAMQDLLRCTGRLQQRIERGVFDGPSALALRDFQREHMIISGGVLDADTRDFLVMDSRERVFRAVLRALRERVADASGLIEDGSAGGTLGQVLGRTLDPPELQPQVDQPRFSGAAADLISPATEAAARALGITDPIALEAFFARYDEVGLRHLRVAVELPPAPSYHAPHMELRAELDRSDVEYGYPFRADGSLRRSKTKRRPALVLFARDGELWRPLVRYQTTIGGWQPEQLAPGVVALRYKGSPVGPRVWRDLVATPAWLPPPTTPDAELVQRTAGGRYAPKYEIMGPGYRSAYGLAMLVHLQPRTGARAGDVASSERTDAGGQELLGRESCCVDQGVRTHGSVAYGSILDGYSHGCHRLFNHLALRLAGFLLAHREHVRHGQVPVLYDRVVHHKGASFALRARSRGYRYELTPPVPIEVLEGRIAGLPKQPIRGARPLRSALVGKANAAAQGASSGSTGDAASGDQGASPPD